MRYQQVDGLHGEELAGRHVPADEVLHLVVVEEGVEVRVREVAVDPRLEVFDVNPCVHNVDDDNGDDHQETGRGSREGS